MLATEFKPVRIFTRLGGFCRPPGGTSGTPEAHPDAVGHNM